MKHQFNVSNSYVLNKLRIVVFPWRHRPWSRKVRRSEASGQSEGYQSPRDDINSPDLYIPSAYRRLIVFVAVTDVLLRVSITHSHGACNIRALDRARRRYEQPLPPRGTGSRIIKSVGRPYYGRGLCEIWVLHPQHSNLGAGSGLGSVWRLQICRVRGIIETAVICDCLFWCSRCRSERLRSFSPPCSSDENSGGVCSSTSSGQ